MSTVKSVQPWCSISSLIIWNRNLRIEEDPHQPEQDQNDQSTSEAKEKARNDDLLLYLSFPEELDPMRKKRKLGLAQGLIDFTRMLSNSQQNINCVQTSSQRLIFYEPEPDYLMQLTIDLPHYATPSGHARQPSSGSAASTNSGSDGPIASDEGLDDQIFLSAIRQAYEQFLLLYGPFSELLTTSRDALEKALDLFYRRWMTEFDPQCATFGRLDFGTHLGGIPTRLLPKSEEVETAQKAFISAHPNTHLILLEYQDLIELPSLTSSPGVGALARFIRSSKCKNRPAEAKDPKTAKATGKEKKSSGKQDSWTSTLGISALGSYLAIPTFSSSDTSVSETSTNSLPRGSPSSGSWMRAVSWGNKTRPTDSSTPESSPSKDPTSPPVALEPTKIDLEEIASALSDADSDSDDSDVAEHIAKLSEKTGLHDVDGQDEDETPKASAIRMFQQVSDPEVWTASTSTKESLGLEAQAPKSSSEVKEPQSSIPHDSIRVYLRSSQRWIDVTILQVKHWTLAVFDNSEVRNHSTALSEDAFKLLQAISASTSTPKPDRSAFRYLLQDSDHVEIEGKDWPDNKDLWSGSKGAAKESDIVGALLAGQSGFDLSPKTNESYTRTGTNQWSIAIRSENGSEAYMVLPKKFGVESSLVDAAREVAKLGL